MPDIIEPAENAVAGYPGQYANNRERMVALFPDLLAELKAARAEAAQWKALWRQNADNASDAIRERDQAVAENERLREFEWMYKGLR